MILAESYSEKEGKEEGEEVDEEAVRKECKDDSLSCESLRSEER